MSTKKELIREMAEIGITHDEARMVVESLMDEIMHQLEHGESVMITNFGKFECREHDGREVTDPQTGETHEVDSHTVVHFKPSKNFKNRFNSNDE